MEKNISVQSVFFTYGSLVFLISAYLIFALKDVHNQEIEDK